MGSVSPAWRASDAVDAQHQVLVGQLAPVLDQEARLADELVGLLGLDAARAVAPVVGLGHLVLVVVLVLRLGGDAVLEDGVEVGFDVVGIDVLVLLLLLLVVAGAGAAGLGRGGLGRGGRSVGLDVLFVAVVVVVEVVALFADRLVVLVEILFVLVGFFAELLGVEFFGAEVFVVGHVVFSHRVPSRVGLARRIIDTAVGKVNSDRVTCSPGVVRAVRVARQAPQRGVTNGT